MIVDNTDTGILESNIRQTAAVNGCGAGNLLYGIITLVVIAVNRLIDTGEPLILCRVNRLGAVHIGIVSAGRHIDHVGIERIIAAGRGQGIAFMVFYRSGGNIAIDVFARLLLELEFKGLALVSRHDNMMFAAFISDYINVSAAYRFILVINNTVLFTHTVTVQAFKDRIRLIPCFCIPVLCGQHIDPRIAFRPYSVHPLHSRHTASVEVCTQIIFIVRLSFGLDMLGIVTQVITIIIVAASGMIAVTQSDLNTGRPYVFLVHTLPGIEQILRIGRISIRQ